MMRGRAGFLSKKSASSRGGNDPAHRTSSSRGGSSSGLGAMSAPSVLEAEMSSSAQHMTSSSVDEMDSSTAQQQMRRGVTRGIEAAKLPEQRYLATLGDFCVKGSVARTKMSVVVKAFLRDPYLSWKDWPTSTKNNVWRKYLDYVQFPPGEEERARELSDSYVSRNYSRWMWRAREGAKLKHGELMKALDDPPYWIPGPVWKSLCKIWSEEEWLARSRAAKSNRASTMSLVYTGGTMPFEEKVIELGKKRGRKLSHLEAFEECHTTKKEKRITSERARNLIDEYGAKLKGNDAEESSVCVSDPELNIWKNVVGRVKKGRIVGLPRQKFTSSKGTQSTATSQSTATIQERKLEQLEQRMQEKMSVKDNEIQLLHKKLDMQGKAIEILMRELGRSAPSVPPTQFETTNGGMDLGDDDSQHLEHIDAYLT